MAGYLVVIGDREALGWVLTEQRMAFPDARRPEVRTLAQRDQLLLYTTMGCFKNPGRDRGRCDGTRSRSVARAGSGRPAEVRGPVFPRWLLTPSRAPGATGRWS